MRRRRSREPVVPKMLIDRDGDAANNGTGFGKPAKDLSVNFVPVPYPDYPPATLAMKPGRAPAVARAECLRGHLSESARAVPAAPRSRSGSSRIDGVPLNAPTPMTPPPSSGSDHIGVPPGARVEFIVTGPPPGVPALLVTRTVDTGQGGENDPNRALATITAAAEAPEPRVEAADRTRPLPLPPPRRPWLGDVAPVRVRQAVFLRETLRSEEPQQRHHVLTSRWTAKSRPPSIRPPTCPTSWCSRATSRTGSSRTAPPSCTPSTSTSCIFCCWTGPACRSDEPFLRDTVNVPYFNGRMLQYPSVRLRMDFRDPDTVGTFVYHCHLLEHEDGGMMGLVRVAPCRRAHDTERTLDAVTSQSLRCNSARVQTDAARCRAINRENLHETHRRLASRVAGRRAHRARLTGTAAAVGRCLDRRRGRRQPRRRTHRDHPSST